MPLEATLRTDLNQLEQEGLLTRTHGGAALNDSEENKNSNESFGNGSRRTMYSTRCQFHCSRVS